MVAENESAQVRNPSAKRRYPRWALGLAFCAGTTLVAVIAMFAVLMIYIARWYAEGERQLEAEVAHLAANSEPATPEELDAYYQLPAGKPDATELWLEAVASFSTQEFRDETQDLPVIGVRNATISDPGQPWDEQAAVRDLLLTYHAHMEKLHAAAALGGAARYPSDFEEGLLADSEVVHQLRAAAHMLNLQAHLAAHDRDSAGAVRCIRTMFALARSLEDYPQLIQQLVRIAIAGHAYKTLSQLLPFLDVDEEARRTLMDELAEHDYDRGLFLAFVGERVSALHLFDHPELAMDEVEVDPQLLQQWSRTWLKRDRAFYLQQMRRLIEVTGEPWPDKLAQAGQVRNDVDRVLRGGKLVRIQYLFSALLLPSMDTTFEATGRAVAARDAAIVILAIEAFRQTNGAPPDSLNQLVPEYLAAVPLDPFDGQPLRYRVDSDQYLIYSIGGNLRDDGGQADDRLDMVLSVKLVE